MPKVSIVKKFKFDSAHCLPNHEGMCQRLHGHSYVLEIGIEGYPQKSGAETGMVMDFGNLKQIVNREVIDKLDHRLINETIENPTAENMAIWIWETLMFDAHLKGISKITLWETPSSRACLNVKGMLSILSSKIEKGE